MLMHLALFLGYVGGRWCEATALATDLYLRVCVFPWSCWNWETELGWQKMVWSLTWKQLHLSSGWLERDSPLYRRTNALICFYLSSRGPTWVVHVSTCFLRALPISPCSPILILPSSSSTVAMVTASDQPFIGARLQEMSSRRARQLNQSLSVVVGGNAVLRANVLLNSLFTTQSCSISNLRRSRNSTCFGKWIIYMVLRVGPKHPQGTMHILGFLDWLIYFFNIV